MTDVPALPPLSQGPDALPGAVLRMTDQEAETAFVASAGRHDGKPVWPHCGCPTVYECRRPNGALRFRCKACRKDFAITSRDLFAFHKMPLRNYLAAIAIFVQRGQGQVRAGAVPRSGRAVQDRVRAGAQAARGDGVRVEGDARSAAKARRSKSMAPISAAT